MIRKLKLNSCKINPITVQLNYHLVIKHYKKRQICMFYCPPHLYEKKKPLDPSSYGCVCCQA